MEKEEVYIITSHGKDYPIKDKTARELLKKQELAILELAKKLSEKEIDLEMIDAESIPIISFYKNFDSTISITIDHSDPKLRSCTCVLKEFNNKYHIKPIENNLPIGLYVKKVNDISYLYIKTPFNKFNLHLYVKSNTPIHIEQGEHYSKEDYMEIV